MKVRAMPTCTARRDGVTESHAHGSAGRHVLDDRNVDGSGQQKP